MSSNHLEAVLLTRLTYASRAAAHLNESDFKLILQQAQENNSRAGITGMLFFNKQYFLQTIEGPRSLLGNLLNKLVADNRHYDLQILESIDINQRIWPSWSMNYATPTSKNNEVYMKHSTTSGFNPYLLSAEAAHNLLKELSSK